MAIHAESVSELARLLGRIPAEMAAGLREELPEIAQILERRSQANSAWSRRIPGAHYVKVSVGAAGGALVGVNAADAPHARPYEGLSSGGSRGFFRHPTNDTPNVWVTQATRPFLAPAAEETRPELVDAVSDLIRQITSL